MDNPVTIKCITSYRIQALAKEMGIEATYAFLDAHWHTHFYVPATVTKTLIQRVGNEWAAVLVELYPDQYYQPPKPDKILEIWRNHEISKLKAQGCKVNVLSKRFKITRQRINQITREVDPSNDPNLTLDF